MAVGRRCTIGCETWPDEPLYVKCPICGEQTERYRDMEPLDSAEARAIRMQEQSKDAVDPNVAAFEKFYARRCRARGIPVDGPLPLEYEQRLS